MKMNETIKLVANNLWLYKKEKSYVDFRNALTSVAKEQQEITKQEMIEKAKKSFCNVACKGNEEVGRCFCEGNCDKFNTFVKLLEE